MSRPLWNDRLSAERAGAEAVDRWLEAHRGCALLPELRVKTEAIWHVRTGCWTVGVTAEELRICQEIETQTGIARRLAFLMLGKGDRFVLKAPAPPAGLFTAPVADLEKWVSHSFGTGAATRLYWCVERQPWQLCASLDELGLAL